MDISSLKGKTKTQLIELIVEKEEELENLQEVLSKLQAINENSALGEYHLNRNKVYDSINISKERIGLALDILTPVSSEVTSKLEKITDDEEVIIMANNVLRNELTKIAKQQQTELNYKIEVRNK